MAIIKSGAKSAAQNADAVALAPEQVVEQLRAMRQQMPDLDAIPLTRSEKLRMRRQINISSGFAHEAIGAVGDSEVVQRAVGNTPEELHAAEDEMARWDVVEAELRVLLRGVAAANLVRRHRIARAAMHAYRISRELVQQDDHAHLAERVDTLRRMRASRRRRTKPAAEPIPLPAPLKQQ